MVRLLQGFTTAHSLPVTQQPTSHCQPVSLPSPCTGAALSGDKKPKINLQAGSSLTAYHNPLKRVTRTKRLQAASPRHFLMCSEEMCCPPSQLLPLPSLRSGGSLSCPVPLYNMLNPTKHQQAACQPSPELFVLPQWIRHSKAQRQGEREESHTRGILLLS